MATPLPPAPQSMLQDLEAWSPGGLEVWRPGGHFLNEIWTKPYVFQCFWATCAQNHCFFKDSGKYVLKTIGFSMILRIPEFGNMDLQPNSDETWSPIPRAFFEEDTWPVDLEPRSLGAWELGDLETWKQGALQHHSRMPRRGRRIITTTITIITIIITTT